ncbi:MAG: hypothetical protein AB1668_01040 [Nanoarchaeota archaeon]
MTHIHILGDRIRTIRSPAEVAEEFNRQVEAEERRKELEEKLRSRAAKAEPKPATIKIAFEFILAFFPSTRLLY